MNETHCGGKVNWKTFLLSTSRRESGQKWSHLIELRKFWCWKRLLRNDFHFYFHFRLRFRPAWCVLCEWNAVFSPLRSCEKTNKAWKISSTSAQKLMDFPPSKIHFYRKNHKLISIILIDAFDTSWIVGFYRFFFCVFIYISTILNILIFTEWSFSAINEKCVKKKRKSVKEEM